MTQRCRGRIVALVAVLSLAGSGISFAQGQAASATAAEIVSKMVSTYQSLRNVRETVDGVEHRIIGTTQFVHATLLYRDDEHFHLTMRADFLGHVFLFEALANEGRYQENSDGAPEHEYGDVGDLQAAIIGASFGGFGSAASYTLPLLRSGTNQPVRLPAFLRNVTRLPDESDREGRYFVLESTEGAEQINRIWVRQDSYLIAKVAFRYGRFASELTLHQQAMGPGDKIPEKLAGH